MGVGTIITGVKFLIASALISVILEVLQLLVAAVLPRLIDPSRIDQLVRSGEVMAEPLLVMLIGVGLLVTILVNGFVIVKLWGWD